MSRVFRKILACVLIVTTILCSVTLPTFISSADSEGMQMVLNESFDYASLTAGMVELGRNFEMVAAGTGTVGDAYHNFNGDKLNIGSYGAVRYNKTLNNSYELTYDFKQIANASNATGRNTGKALIVGNALEDPISTTYESYPSGPYTLAASGLALYLWDSSALIYVRRYITGDTNKWDYDAVCSNVPIGANVETSEVTIKVVCTKNSSNTVYDFYCNDVIFATVTCSNKETITTPIGTFESYTSVTGINKKNKESITKENAVVAVNGTFVFSSRPIVEHTTYTVDNLTLKTSSDLPQNSTIFTENFDYTQDNLQAELAKNFFVSYKTSNGEKTFINSGITVSNGELKLDGYSSVKYRNAVSGSSSLAFDYRYEATSDDSSAYGVASGAAILYRTSLTGNQFDLFEEKDIALGTTGICFYMWKSYLSIFVHTIDSNGVLHRNTIVENCALGTSVYGNSARITIDDDGNGNVRFFCNTILIAQIKLAALTEGDGYESVKGVYAKSGTIRATDSNPILNPLVAKSSATFAFARNERTANSHKICISNMRFEASSTNNMLANNGDEYNVALQSEIEDMIGLKFYISTFDHPEVDKLALVKVGANDALTTISEYKLKESSSLTGSVTQPAQMVINNARGYELIYALNVNITPKEMSDTYRIIGYLGDTLKFTTSNYSFKGYAEAIITAGDSSFTPETVALCKAMLNYGAEAQDYLDYEIKGANQNISAVDQASSAITNYDSYKPRKEGNFTNVTFTGFNLTLKSIISLKLYFQVNNGAISDYTFKVDGETRTPVEVQQDGGTKPFYCIEITGIRPDKYDHMYEVSFDGVTVRCSVYSYAYSLMQTTAVKYDAMKSLMGYMREYSDAVKEYVGDFSKTNNYISMKSETNVSAEIPIEKTSEKQVGLFYFILHGTGNSTANYDNSKVLANLRQAGLVDSNGVTLAEWQEAGGGNEKYNSFWGESMFGYYDSLDEWVVDKHVQMFIQANLDYIIVDTTNGLQGGTAYLARIRLLFTTLQKYAEQGFKVPKVAFMCYDDGTDTVDALYANIYVAHPEWNNLFYHWNNHQKPVIFDNIASYNKSATGQIDTATKLSSYVSGVTDYFEIRDVAFPHETNNSNSNVWNGQSLIYLDFRTTSDKFTDSADNNYSFMSVSVSEISATNHASYNIFSETSDRSRNFDGTRNLEWLNPGDTGYIADVYKYGVNFAREFNNAITKNPDNIFITGWNEWEAYLQINNDSISFIDCADINNSRDIEPMTGGYGDNYYLQMCYFIQQFKYGTATGSSESSNTYTKTIDLNGNFSQWYDTNVSTYLDAKGDSDARNHKSAQDSSVIYTENATPNDFTVMKVTSDANNFYFYARTSVGLDLSSDIVLLISTAGTTDYDYKVVISSGSTTLYTIAGSEVCTISRKISGAHLMLSIPRSSIGMTASRKIGFKWTTGIDITNSDEFYTVGDCAPYGRFSFIYS